MYIRGCRVTYYDTPPAWHARFSSTFATDNILRRSFPLRPRLTLSSLLPFQPSLCRHANATSSHPPNHPHISFMRQRSLLCCAKRLLRASSSFFLSIYIYLSRFFLFFSSLLFSSFPFLFFFLSFSLTRTRHIRIAAHHIADSKFTHLQPSDVGLCALTANASQQHTDTRQISLETSI